MALLKPPFTICPTCGAVCKVEFMRYQTDADGNLTPESEPLGVYRDEQAEALELATHIAEEHGGPAPEEPAPEEPVTADPTDIPPPPPVS